MISYFDGSLDYLAFMERGRDIYEEQWQSPTRFDRNGNRHAVAPQGRHEMWSPSAGTKYSKSSIAKKRDSSLPSKDSLAKLPSDNLFLSL